MRGGHAPGLSLVTPVSWSPRSRRGDDLCPWAFLRRDNQTLQEPQSLKHNSAQRAVAGRRAQGERSTAILARLRAGSADPGSLCAICAAHNHPPLSLTRGIALPGSPKSWSCIGGTPGGPCSESASRRCVVARHRAGRWRGALRRSRRGGGERFRLGTRQRPPAVAGRTISSCR
jgi:hypothetical protein